jgi:hypothetical protein
MDHNFLFIMNFKAAIFTVWFILFECIPGKGQGVPAAIIESVFAEVSDDLPEDMDYSELSDRLAGYLREPVHLNRTDGRELRELLFLSPVEVAAILKHREEAGDYADLLELQSVEGLSLSKIRLLLPFVTLRTGLFSGMTRSKNTGARLKQDIMIRYGRVIEKQAGYRNAGGATDYEGSPDKLFIRYKLQAGNYAGISLMVTKDAGEAFAPKAFKSVDLSSANLSLTGKGLMQRIVIGNYRLQFGQGATLWSGMAMGKSGSAAAIPRWGTGLSSSSSHSMIMALRGFAVTMRADRFLITPFFSSVRKDATLKPDVNTGVQEVTSLSETGLYRTPNERDKKNNLGEQVQGACVQYLYRGMSIGILGFSTKFSRPFRAGEALYDRFTFAGRNLENAAFFYNHTWKNATFFGEEARCSWNGTARVHGLIAGLSPPLALILLYREYSRDYTSFFNQGIAESAGAAESGFYTGFSFSPTATLNIDVYADRFRFPWLKYRVDAPSAGEELYSGVLMKNLFRATSVRLLCRYKRREENGEPVAAVSSPDPVTRINLRLDLSAKLCSRVEWRSRMERVTYRKGSLPQENGLLFYHDILYDPLNSAFSGSIRFTVFDTKSYNSRVYAYENDVLYAYSNPAFQDTGSRFYLNTRLRLSKRITIWARYARTVYVDRNMIGSSGEEIEGPVKSEFRLQLRIVQ